MDIHEFSNAYAQAYKDLMETRSDDDYVRNEKQCNKMLEAIEFFSGMEYCEIVEIEVVPRLVHGGLTVRFEDMFYTNGNELLKFSNILNSFSAISIHVENDKDIVMSFVIPYIFKRK